MNEYVYTNEKSQITNFNLLIIKKALYNTTKRLFDLIFATIGLVLLIPITIIVKILYILTGDFDSIFFVQERIGLHGKPFNLFKFRTMIPNADEELIKLLNENPSIKEEYEINKKLSNDPRVTKTGKIIRKFSIDELPQVINIFLGNMTVVGNRPYLPREKEDMGLYYNSIVSTKPGLTGYWQVHGRNTITFQDRLRLEKYYSMHYGIKMDIKIFFKTFKVVIFGRDAK